MHLIPDPIYAELADRFRTDRLELSDHELEVLLAHCNRQRNYHLASRVEAEIGRRRIESEREAERLTREYALQAAAGDVGIREEGTNDWTLFDRDGNPIPGHEHYDFEEDARHALRRLSESVQSYDH